MVKKYDWKAIRLEYIAGEISYRKLAEKHGVSFSTLKEVARREKWTDLRKSAQHKADTKFAEEIGKKQAIRSAKILDVADKLLDKISETIETMPTMDSYVIKQFTSALKDLKDIKGVKSDIDLREQEARIAKLQREAQESDDSSSKEVVITIEGGEESWSS